MVADSKRRLRNDAGVLGKLKGVTTFLVRVKNVAHFGELDEPHGQGGGRQGC